MIEWRYDLGGSLLVAVALASAAWATGCGDDDPGTTPATSGSGGAGAAGGQGGAGAAAGGAGGQDPTGGQGGTGGSATTPSLCNPGLIDAFGDYSGPVAVDGDANVFAGAWAFLEDETIVRAYGAATVAPGMGAVAGTELFIFPGGSSQLAAVAPDGESPGLVAIAGYGGDPLVQGFTVAGDIVQPSGSLEALVELVTPDLVSVTADDAGRLWVGIPDLDGQQMIVVARTPSADCLDPVAYEALVTVPSEAARCVVGVHAAPGMPSAAPTWGRHGGLLTVRPGATGAVVIERWSAPAGPTDPIAPAATTVDIGVARPFDTEIFLAFQAIDLPNFDWTVVSYTTPDSTGEVLAVAGDTVAERFDVVGFFSGAAFPGGAHGRLVHSGQSALGTTAPGAQALYGADLCAATTD